VRRLSDGTLVVFVSDCHIGGDKGRDIFETPDELASLFDALGSHDGPVELVLAGDFFDFLRLGDVPEGENRASATLARAEYRELFDSVRRFAAGQSRRVIYLPGNHDAEAWWNPEIQAELRRQGVVHEFALFYAAAFESDPERIVYCEHGNQFDPANTIHDYADPFDTPLGEHVVTEITPRLASGGTIGGLHLRDIDRVFPLTTIPDWASGRLFYGLVKDAFRWLLLPLLIGDIAYQVGHTLGTDGSLGDLFLGIGYHAALLLVVFGLFLFAVRRTMTWAGRRGRLHFQAASEREATGDATVAEIRTRLEGGEPPPLARDLQGEIRVFVSGHTHAPSLTEFEDRGERRGALVNSGCWLRQLQPVAAHLGAPPVYVGRFVQTHVRVYREAGAIEVELWEHPRPSPQELPLAERLAAAGRMPPDHDPDASPRPRSRLSVGLTSATRSETTSAEAHR
jgi:UDP-2,3-diacylglucosamine pyrophosphatase LpxH